MPIIRCTAQSSRSLRDFYNELSRQYKEALKEGLVDEDDINGAAKMLDFLKMADGLFPETTLWALTNDAQLVLLADNDPDSAWYVTVTLSTEAGYCFRLAKPNAGPDEWKTLKQKTEDPEEARRLFLTAMDKSGGWKGNPELSKLLPE